VKISLYNNFVNWLEGHLGSCFYKKYFGIECPGCGMQRSFIEILKGNIFESIVLYPALLPMIFTLIFMVFHIIFKYKNGALILKISFIFTVLLMIIAYIVKLINTN
jgi:hypothetical protein